MFLEQILQLDWTLFFFFNNILSTPWLDRFMLAMSDAYVWGLAALVFFGVLSWQKKISYGIILSFILTLTLCDVFASYGLKKNIERYRPCYQREVLLKQESCGGNFGMPSNHAANAMAAAVFIAQRNLIKLKWIPFVLAGIVGLSRIYLGVHFPFDVLAGFLLGGLIGLISFKVSQGIYAKN